MGNEIGQMREWDEKREQDWNLMTYPAHDSFYTFISDLNAVYLSHPALWKIDHFPAGFSWLDCHQEEKCIYILQRNSSKEHLIAAFNLSDKKHDVSLNIPGNSLTELINTNWEKYGGSVPVEADAPGQTLTLAPFSGILYKITDKVMK